MLHLLLQIALASGAPFATSADHPLPPTPPRQLSGSLSDADYPAAARGRGAQGVMELAIDVGANGRVAGCTVLKSAGDAELDSTTCELVRRRFRYQPATKDGQPVPQRITRRVTWKLPQPAAAPAQPPAAQ